jgi:plasmid stabilization system protein ParE
LKVIWSPRARQKAREAVDFIKEDRPLASGEWLEGLVQRVLLLEEVPDQGRIVPEWGQPDVREVLHPPYRVLYQVSSERVEILTLSHMRQELEGQSGQAST